MSEIRKATADDAGCWIDGATGWRGAAEVVEIAWAHGMDHTTDDVLIIQSFKEQVSVTLSDGTKVSNGVNDTQNASDYILDQGGMSDVAENWLNDNVAPEGYHFGWEDGEFFLSADEGDDE